MIIVTSATPEMEANFAAQAATKVQIEKWQANAVKLRQLGQDAKDIATGATPLPSTAAGLALVVKRLAEYVARNEFREAFDE